MTIVVTGICFGIFSGCCFFERTVRARIGERLCESGKTVELTQLRRDYKIVTLSGAMLATVFYFFTLWLVEWAERPVDPRLVQVSFSFFFATTVVTVVWQGWSYWKIPAIGGNPNNDRWFLALANGTRLASFICYFAYMIHFTQLGSNYR